MASRRYTNFYLLMRLLRQARPYWPHLVALLVISFLATPLALLMPLPLAMVVDGLSGSKWVPGSWLLQQGTNSLTEVLVLAVVFLVGLSLLDQVQKLASSLLGTYVGEKTLLGFRAQIFRHVQRLSLGYHDTKGTADSNYRIHWDAAAIQWIAIYGLPPSSTACLTLVGMIYVTARINGQLALVALAVSPVLFLITFVASRRLRSGWEATKNLESTVYTVVQEVLTSLRVVKAFGQEDREHGRFVNHSGESMRARVGVALVEGIFGLLFGVTLAVGTGLVLFIGGREVSRGNLGIGELVLVMGYLAQLYLPVQVISKGIATVQNALASAQRVFELLDEAVEVTEKRDARPLRRAGGAVAFRNVSFAYNGDDFVLRGVSFGVSAGTRVGIAGATGAGKTTLMSLLFRFYDPTTGQILLDGVDLRDYKLADLRNQFSLVLQEPVLFSTTVAENIAYARPEATEDEIVEAAKAANAHDFIVNLSNGYQALVGERGVRLSGGERQRIALARAFLKDAPILILDEPTSSVDIKTEAVIMEAMERLMSGRTTFLITHRLGILASCDAQLELDAGGISSVTPPKSPIAADVT
ncbi:MAG TPA: ABC transporter ATP-binding protein [Candidatus Binatia bacterium]|nr:ABC transporter ATP-binding protein [Candidatus Binatia bacterium]HEV8621021.1 ABC transporter ATP-binding protein [Nitrospiraceae bacterium]